MVIKNANFLTILLTILLLIPVCGVNTVFYFLPVMYNSIDNLTELASVLIIIPFLISVAIGFDILYFTLLKNMTEKIVIDEIGIRKIKLSTVMFQATWEEIIEIGVDQSTVAKSIGNYIYISLVPTGARSGTKGFSGKDIGSFVDNEVFISIPASQKLYDTITEHYSKEKILILKPLDYLNVLQSKNLIKF